VYWPDQKSLLRLDSRVNYFERACFSPSRPAVSLPCLGFWILASKFEGRCHKDRRLWSPVVASEYEMIEYTGDTGGTSTPSLDLAALLAGVLGRWKLIGAITLFASIATYGGVQKFVPRQYKSTAEILVFDPQQQMDASVQKPISPFVENLGPDATNAQIRIIRSKSVALHVVRELNLDTDPEFQLHNPLAALVGRSGSPGAGTADNTNAHDNAEEEAAERLDQAADILQRKMDVWGDSYIISISVSSQDPIKAQRLASTVANEYLTNQREARQEALKRVASWLKDRVTNLQSSLLETQTSIEQLKAKSGITTDAQLENVKEQKRELDSQLSAARTEVDEKRAHLEQVRRVLDTNGDIESIPALTASATLTQLRQKQTGLKWRAEKLQRELGDQHPLVIAAQTALDGVNREINAEAEHVLGNMKNIYDLAVQRQQSLETRLQHLTADGNSEANIKLRRLERIAETDRNLYQSYLSQYNDVSERSTLLDTSARIISPASVPRSPSSSRLKLYALGGMLGLAGALMLAFLMEYLRRSVRTGAEVEQSFGQPVLGCIPFMEGKKSRGASLHGQILQSMVNEPLSQLSEAVRTMRISIELGSANPKVVLITSALPAEGKSTAAMLLAASSASSGKRTVLLDCDLRKQSSTEAFGSAGQPGLSDLLGGTVKLVDVLFQDSATKVCLIPAGSIVPNAADLLIGQRMRDLIAELREKFDYIVLDAPPLLPVVDALALATIADKILVIVEWGRTSRRVISDAFKVLRPEAHRIAGVVLNKADLKLLGYGYPYGYRN
jgi:succinoglycan biosynthesis transport protein ExoP